MSQTVTKACAALAFVAATLLSPSVIALPESTRGPFYVQGTTPLGFGSWSFRGYHGSWRPDVEFGIHFNGRHDGLVLAVRQAFHVSVDDAGDIGAATVVRLGYDIAIPINKYEITIAPYGTIGLGYVFWRFGPSAGLQTAGGVDGKFFIIKGFYAFARPFELGIQCFHDGAGCALAFVTGAGVGFAFPSP
jgi:hypothetical protein